MSKNYPFTTSSGKGVPDHLYIPIVKQYIQILIVYNVLAILSILGYVGPHIFEIWDTDIIINPLLVYPESNLTEPYLIVGVCGS